MTASFIRSNCRGSRWSSLLIGGSAALSLLRAGWELGRRLRVRCRVQLGDFVKTCHTQRLFQVIERPFRLSVLLVQQVVENVFVSLDEPLGVLLTVLKLLIAITLDALEKSGKGKLLLMSQLSLFLLNDGLHL